MDHSIYKLAQLLLKFTRKTFVKRNDMVLPIPTRFKLHLLNFLCKPSCSVKGKLSPNSQVIGMNRRSICLLPCFLCLCYITTSWMNIWMDLFIHLSVQLLRPCTVNVQNGQYSPKDAYLSVSLFGVCGA